MKKAVLVFLLFIAGQLSFGLQAPYLQKKYPQAIFEKKQKTPHEEAQDTIFSYLKDYSEQKMPILIALYQDKMNGKQNVEISDDKKESLEQIRERTKNYQWISKKTRPISKKNNDENEFNEMLKAADGDINKAINKAYEDKHDRSEQFFTWVSAKINAESPTMPKKPSPLLSKKIQNGPSGQQKTANNNSKGFKNGSRGSAKTFWPWSILSRIAYCLKRTFI